MTSPAAATEVRRAGEADIAAVSRILAAAFDDDPVLNWFVRQDERHGEAMELLLRGGAERAVRDHGECYLTDDECGAAVWQPPGFEGPPPDPAARERLAAEICNTAEGRRRFAQFAELMAEHHPAEPPNFYLGAIGVLPALQRGGLGSLLIRAVLDRCDREGIPASLISTRERNLPLYQRHGFVVRARVELPGGGPSLWPMWREPLAEQRG